MASAIPKKDLKKTPSSKTLNSEKKKKLPSKQVSTRSLSSGKSPTKKPRKLPTKNPAKLPTKKPVSSPTKKPVLSPTKTPGKAPKKTIKKPTSTKKLPGKTIKKPTSPKKPNKKILNILPKGVEPFVEDNIKGGTVGSGSSKFSKVSFMSRPKATIFSS